MVNFQVKMGILGCFFNINGWFSYEKKIKKNMKIGVFECFLAKMGDLHIKMDVFGCFLAKNG
jgi:hypothetical protein